MAVKPSSVHLWPVPCLFSTYKVTSTRWASLYNKKVLLILNRGVIMKQARIEPIGPLHQQSSAGSSMTIRLWGGDPVFRGAGWGLPLDAVSRNQA